MNNNYYAKLAKNKSLLKEYNTSDCSRSVYLEDGDEFQIQLFNPETTEISARIYIEDSQLSHDIVLKPGERLWLERYTDVSKKFKFVTYIVDGNDAQVKKAISHNGIIKIEFFRRKQKPQYGIWYNDNNTYRYNWGDNIIYCDCNVNNARYLDANCCDSVLSFSCDASDFSNSAATAANSSITSQDAVNCFYTSGISTSAATISQPSCSTAVYNSEWHKDTKNLETGRIAEGRKSNQKFETVNMDFEYWPFRTETIKIFPLSRKPYNSNDLKKLYCSNCGRKLNTKYKYCPYCGAKID